MAGEPAASEGLRESLTVGREAGMASDRAPREAPEAAAASFKTWLRLTASKVLFSPWHF